VSLPALDNLTHWRDDDLSEIVTATFEETGGQRIVNLKAIRVEHWRGPVNSVRAEIESPFVAVLKIPRPGRFEEDIITRLGRALDDEHNAVPDDFLKHVCYAIRNLFNGLEAHTCHIAETIAKEVTWSDQLRLRRKTKRRRYAPNTAQAELENLQVQHDKLVESYEQRKRRSLDAIHAAEVRLAKALEGAEKEKK
jgi:hypothetical protein